jgi:DNA-binding PadR family transcriptional regulator
MQSPPLTPAVLYVLLALAVEDRHGYAIMRDAEMRSEGRFRMGPGTVYGTIKRLLEAEFVEEAGVCEEDERRRLYRLTERGRGALAEEVSRLDLLLRHPSAVRILGRSL